MFVEFHLSFMYGYCPDVVVIIEPVATRSERYSVGWDAPIPDTETAHLYPSRLEHHVSLLTRSNLANIAQSWRIEGKRSSLNEVREVDSGADNRGRA